MKKKKEGVKVITISIISESMNYKNEGTNKKDLEIN